MGSQWVFFQKLTDPDAGFIDGFGETVKAQDDDLFVRSVGDEPTGYAFDFDCGSVTQFHFDGTLWQWVQKIMNPDVPQIGRYIALEDDLCVFHATATVDDLFNLQVYRKTGMQWSLEAVIPVSGNEVGFTVHESAIYCSRSIGLDEEILRYDHTGGSNWAPTLLFTNTLFQDQSFQKLAVSGNFLLLGSGGHATSTEPRKFPLLCYQTDGQTWNYVGVSYGNAQEGDDDNFGSFLLARDNILLISAIQEGLESPFGQLYRIDLPELITQKFAKDQPMVYPVPTNGPLHFNQRDISRIEIFTADGRLMATKNATEPNSISDFPNGIYFARTTTNDAQHTFKVIKN